MTNIIGTKNVSLNFFFIIENVILKNNLKSNL